MGVDFYQNCIIGVEIHIESLKVVVQEKIVEKQPRYNTKTGKVDRYEDVVVKEEESYYKLMDVEIEDVDYLEEVADNLSRNIDADGLDYLIHEGYLYFGVCLDPESGDRFHPIESDLNLEEITDIFTRVKKVKGLPEGEIRMYLFGRVS